MTEERMALLEQRLAEMERTLARTRRRSLTAAVTLGLLCAFAGLAGGHGRAAADTTSQGLTVTAPFSVVSTSGAPLLRVDQRGLRYYHGGIAVATLAYNSGGELSIADEHGAPRVVMAGGQSHGGGAVGLFGKSGALVAILAENPNGGDVSIFSQNRQPLAALRPKADGSGEVVAFDQAGHRAQLDIRGGVPGVRIFANKTRELAAMGGTSTGGAIRLYDASGAPATGLGTTSDGGYVELYNKGDQPVAQMEVHPGGTGYLGLASAAGIARVQAGVNKQDDGVVRAFGPTGFNFIEGRGGQ